MENMDLSDYERIRLENIRRNESFLDSIGISSLKPAAPAVKKRSRDNNSSKTKLAKKSKTPVLPTRTSRRLRAKEGHENLAEEDQSESEASEDGVNGIDYMERPLGPEELDDNEFEVFVVAKSWRLKKCRALETEPYKVFNNATLCHVIRLRRNNPKWAPPDNRAESMEAHGIANAKLASGFPEELLAVLESRECAAKLEASRQLSPNFENS